MYRDEQEDTITYNVVINHEEQYSIWPANQHIPLGWKSAGKSGLKAECLAYIGEVWTDMRPLSLRKKIEEVTQRPAQFPSSEPLSGGPAQSVGDDLIKRLATGDHPVEICLRPERTLTVLQECINRGYVHIKFTDTKGGTELGVRLNRDASDFSQADFENHAGRVQLVGSLTLNYVKIKCIADIDLASLAGQGHFNIVEAD